MSARMRLATTSSAVTLAALMMLGTTTSLSASPIATPIAFSTSGSVDGVGVVGDPIIVFQGVQYGSLTTGDTFNLGRFAVAGTSIGGSATYTDVPFQIAFRSQSIDGSAPSPNETPVLLQGTLSAVVTDGKLVSLSAKFPFMDVPANPPPFLQSIPAFRTGGYMNYLYVTNNGEDGRSIQAVLNVTPVPEPTSMLVFAAAAGLVALRSRRARP